MERESDRQRKILFSIENLLNGILEKEKRERGREAEWQRVIKRGR